MLRKRPSFAKSFRSLSPTPCQNFCSYEIPLWHTSAISQPKPSFRSCEILQRFISQPKHPLRNHFTAAKRPFGTRVRNGLRNAMRKCPLATKMPLGCKMSLCLGKAQPSLKFQFKPLNCYFPFRIDHLPCENLPLVRKRSQARAPFPEDLRLKKSPTRTSDHPHSTFFKSAMAKT